MTTQGCKEITDPPMSFGLENVIRGDDEVVEVNGNLGSKTVKEVEVPQKVTPMPRPRPLFPQSLVKKTEDGKYWCFMAMLKQLSINIPFIEAL